MKAYFKKKSVFAGGIVAVLAILAFVAYGRHREAGKASDAENQNTRPRYVKVMTIGEDGANPMELTYSGVVRARYDNSIAFQVGGRVLERKVDKGDNVKKGDLLMRIDPVDLELAVQKAQDAVTAADSDLTLASTNLKRYKDLYGKDAVSKLDLDTQQNNFDVANSRKRSAVTGLTEAKQRLGYATLTAETDGVISARSAEVGDVVAAGQEVLRMERSAEKEIEIDVPEQRVWLFRNPPKDANVEVTFWAHPDLKLEAKVREVAPQADSATRTYPVRLSLPDLPPEIQSGMTANVAASALASMDVVSIPISALIQTSEKPRVWLLENETIKGREVEVGSFMGSNDVQIVSGLSRGDRVVVNGVHMLSEGVGAREWKGHEQ